ncbi:MAG: hypothetical protein V9G19_26165 [Tetrasphaera sp.]
MPCDRLDLALLGSVAAFAAVTGPVARCERQLRAAGGKGIVALELAGTPERGAALLAAWGPSGRSAARRSLLLDFGYQISYAAFGTLLIAWVNRRSGSSDPPARAALALPGVAAVCDAVEGVALLRVMDRGLGVRAVPDAAVAPALWIAKRAAVAKFAVLGLALAHAAARGLGGRARG